MARSVRPLPEDILWPLDKRMAEAIDMNFKSLHRDLFNSVEGILPISDGGTGIGSFNTGDIVVATSTTALGGLAAVATGYAVISQGVGVVPAYGKIGLTTHVSGILPIANGGTNASTAIGAFTNLSPQTTKGDLIGFTTLPVRIPVGADGTALLADSTQAAGVKWDTVNPTHEILQESVHTDAETNAVLRGAMIIGAGLPFNGLTYWLDGAPMPDVDSGVSYGAQKYWSDGGVEGTLGFDDPTNLKWRRLGAAAGTLRNNGTDIYWGDDTPTQPKVKAIRTTNTSIAAGAGGYDALGGNLVDLEAVIFDSHSFWSSGTPSRLTVPAGQAGYYLIVAQASWNTSATGRKAGWIYKNGSRVGIAEVNGDDGGLGLSFTVATFIQLAVGDYVELVVRQDSAGALDLLGEAGGSFTQIQMVRIAL